MPQFFRKTKIDPNDSLYSKIIRYGVDRCKRCNLTKQLQSAHIVGRGHYSTRFMLRPVRNAIPLCVNCHQWFDTHKMKSLIFNPSKRVFDASEESYTFLNVMCGYSWNDIQKLYHLSQEVCAYSKERPVYDIVKKELTEELKRLEAL